MLPQPIDVLFPERSSILVSGGGGGFDLIVGLGVAFALLDRGHTVHLANLSFTPLRGVERAAWLCSGCLRVDADSVPWESYAPEIYLSRWFREQGQERPIFCFEKVGGVELSGAYHRLAEELGLDGLILIDGGVDALFRGDEYSLGTPTLDFLSVAAASSLPLSTKLLACIGFGAERYDRISHAQALAQIAELTKAGAFLGTAPLFKESSVGQRWLSALAFVHRCQGPLHRSIVADSIKAAMEGNFGDTVVNERTRQTPIWISPLTHLHFFFWLDAIAERKPYLAELRQTSDVSAANSIIDAYHRLHQRLAERIPI